MYIYIYRFPLAILTSGAPRASHSTRPTFCEILASAGCALPCRMLWPGMNVAMERLHNF